ncbi:MAG TPA: hypothetical protein VM658_01010 [bacterium]|nr:hypothetical protein [bacterium]
MAAAVGGCPRYHHPSAATPERAAVEERLRRLEVEYQLLQKDHPPQSETLLFRQNIGDAEAALAGGRLAEADRLTAEAEDWITTARRNYYGRHQSQVMSGAGGEKAEDLMASARTLADKAADLKSQGDDWAVGLYYQAAIEQGELALLARQKDPEQAVELINLAVQLQAIYREAGRPEQARQSNGRVLQYLKSSLAVLDKGIQDCLAGTAPECSQADISAGETVMRNKAKEMAAVNDLSIEIAAESKKLDPAGIPIADESGPINAWTISWQAFFNNKKAALANKTPDKIPGKEGQEQILRANLEKHNRLKQGAETIQGSGISLEESEVFISGDAVIIRGKVGNFKTEPIFQPRVTITGQIYSDIIDLGYEAFKPVTNTTFQIQVKGFSADAFNHSLSNLPSHQLLLIYKDAQGREHKVIQPIR